MRARLVTIVATVACAAVATHGGSAAGAATVSLSVTAAGAPAPLFEGTVDTEPHPVDGGDGSGSHPCSGPPGSPASATATGALDDAMRAAGISWRGKWDPSFRDFFIDGIGPYASAPPNYYWSLTVNERFSTGGCLAAVSNGDAVHFFYGALAGPGSPQAPGTTPADGKGGPAVGNGPGKNGRAVHKLRGIARRATRFLQRQRGEEWARLALAVRGDGDPAAAVAALLGPQLRSQRTDGSFGDDVNATALAVLALHRSHPRSAARASAWLIAIQSAEGGFGYRPGVPPDIDTTGLVAWALAVPDRSESRRQAGLRSKALQHAADFIRAGESADGGFPALPGGESNAQSTGLALVALRLAGDDPRRTLSPSGRHPLQYLASLTRRDGSFAYRPGSSPTPGWTTAQALLGLTARAKLLDWDGERDAG